MDPPERATSADREREEDNTEQDGRSTGTCLRALFSHILVGPGREKLRDLTCVNGVYLLFLFWFVLITSSLYPTVIRNKIEQELNRCTRGKMGPQCTELVSAESITLRVGFTLSVVFVIFSLLAVKSSQDGLRARIHQGYWIIKFLFILVLLSKSLVIPVGRFDFVWSVISFVGTLLFQVFQAVLILDFATSASEIFVLKITDERSKLWYFAWLVCVWSIYLTALVLTAVLYIMFVDSCGLGAVLVTTVVVYCALATIVTVHYSDHRTGLLHSGLITLFVLILTLATLGHDGVCRQRDTVELHEGDRLVVETIKFLEIILGFLTVMYAGFRRYNTKHYRYGSSMVTCQLEIETNEEETAQEPEPSNSPEFSSTLFFILLGLFSLFMTSKLTALRTSEYSEPVINNMATFHLRSLTIIIIITMVIWSQIFPALFPSEDPFDLYILVKTLARFSLRTCRRLLIDGCDFCNGPTASRRIFTLLFVLGLTFSCLLYAPAVRHSLSINTYFCTTISSLGSCLSTDPAYMAVYRVCFAMATFYLLFAVILVCVDNTRDPRVDLQYKAWPVKFCLFFSLLFCSFFLPKEFSRVWIYVALAGTFVFTILQLTLLIYWTRNTSKKLDKKVETATSSFWPALLAISTVFLFLFSLGTIITFYVFFTRLPLCITNTFFISLNLVLAIVASVTSVHPKIYDAGLFQCFVIVVFSLYLTWSGLSHNPDERCNPVAGYIAEVDMRPNLNIQAAVDLLFTLITLIYFSNKVPVISEHLRELYERIRSREKTPSSMESQSSGEAECNSIMYNFSLFHLVYFFGSLHATIILTNWFIPTHGSRFKLSVNWAAMCVKMTASSLSLTIYVWCIAAQLLTN